MITKTIRHGVAVGLVFATAALGSGTVSAQTKIKPGFNLFSTEQDLEIGRQSAIEVEKQLPIVNNRAAQACVDAVGRRLAAFIPGAKFPYQFKIVDASDINAFALPGGFMYVNRGLIDAAKNEGQLAGVMAHEMSHVALRHGTNQASKAYLGQTGLGLLGGLLGKDQSSSDKVIGAVGGFGLNAMFLKFSRTDEEQADIVGAQTMAKAGYNPRDMVDFFEMLRAQEARDPSKVEQFFRSHPAPKDRATRIRNEMALLTIQPTAQTAGLKQAKATLAGLPPARSMAQIAKNQPATVQPRTYPDAPTTAANIEAPATTFQTFKQRTGLYSIGYPSNWRSHESNNGSGVTLVPEGGFVDAGGKELDLICGVIVNHYEPFLNDANDTTDSDGRFSFLAPEGERSNRDVSRTALAAATNDLVRQLLRTNPTLHLLPGSQRSDSLDGGAALSLVLSGRSAATGLEERVTVFTRELPDEHIIYALFIAPGQDYAALNGMFGRMIGSLQVSDQAAHR